MQEDWKPVTGYEGKYVVSSRGKVYSLLTSSLLKLTKDDKGYCRVKLYRDGVPKSIRVHRLVAAAFLPNPSNHPVINHKDEDKINNHVDNLEWCDQFHNMNAGTLPERWRERPSCKPVVAFNDLTELTFDSCSKAAESLGLRSNHIAACARGDRKSHGGWMFKWL